MTPCAILALFIRADVNFISGGHTTEMFHLLTDLNYLLFSPRLYVHGSNDQLSATRAIQFEGNTF